MSPTRTRCSECTSFKMTNRIFLTKMRSCSIVVGLILELFRTCQHLPYKGIGGRIRALFARVVVPFACCWGSRSSLHLQYWCAVSLDFLPAKISPRFQVVLALRRTEDEDEEGDSSETESSSSQMSEHLSTSSSDHDDNDADHDTSDHDVARERKEELREKRDCASRERRLGDHTTVGHISSICESSEPRGLGHISSICESSEPRDAASASSKAHGVLGKYRIFKLSPSGPCVRDCDQPRAHRAPRGVFIHGPPTALLPAPFPIRGPSHTAHHRKFRRTPVLEGLSERGRERKRRQQAEKSINVSRRVSASRERGSRSPTVLEKDDVPAEAASRGPDDSQIEEICHTTVGHISSVVPTTRRLRTSICESSEPRDAASPGTSSKAHGVLGKYRIFCLTHPVVRVYNPSTIMPRLLSIYLLLLQAEPTHSIDHTHTHSCIPTHESYSTTLSWHRSHTSEMCQRVRVVWYSVQCNTRGTYLYSRFPANKCRKNLEILYLFAGNRALTSLNAHGVRAGNISFCGTEAPPCPRPDHVALPTGTEALLARPATTAGAAATHARLSGQLADKKTRLPLKRNRCSSEQPAARTTLPPPAAEQQAPAAEGPLPGTTSADPLKPVEKPPAPRLKRQLLVSSSSESDDDEESSCGRDLADRAFAGRRPEMSESEGDSFQTESTMGRDIFFAETGWPDAFEDADFWKVLRV